ncbi:MAG TPA: hypothetical protein VFM47_06885 [Gaiellales bacterium]|nr:hypothetical protein [Gaiellales bacterium]
MSEITPQQYRPRDAGSSRAAVLGLRHLRVLREVGAVDVRDHGRQRLYRINGQALKPIHDWFGQLDAVLEELQAEEVDDGSDE